MDKAATDCRKRILEHIRTLSSMSEQIKYEREVPIANVPAELIDGFSFHPKSEDFLNAFNEGEIKSLAELYGMICIASKKITQVNASTVTEIQKIPEWRAVVAFAKEILVELKAS